MKPIPSPPADREAILDALRREVEAAGGKRVSLRRFAASSGIAIVEVFRHFARWQDAMRAAGFDYRPSNQLIAPQMLLEDWGKVAGALRKFPSKVEYTARGKYCLSTLTHRFGSWDAIPGAFMEFAEGKRKWADLRALIPKLKPNKSGVKRTPLARKHRPAQAPGRCPAWALRSCGGTVYGDPLQFGAMLHAPVNEAGVMLLFAMVAEPLGLMIVSVRPGFPDCEAIKKIGDNDWRRVRIEFEYESGNFRRHGHDPKGCDLIVCWTHNWPECPVEVLALRDMIAGIETKPEIPGR